MEEKSAEELIAEVEEDTETLRWGNDRSKKFIEALEIYEKENNAQKVREMRWEIHIFSMLLIGILRRKERSEGRFAPMMVYSNGATSPSPKSISEEAMDYYEKRAETTENPIHCSRYSDLIWEKRRKHEFARKAISSYLECAPIFVQNGWDMEMADCLQRSTELAMMLNDEAEINKVKTNILEILDQLSEEKQFRWCSELIDCLLEMGDKVSEEEFRIAINVAIKAEEYFKTGVDDLFNFQRVFLEKLIQLNKIIKEDEIAGHYRKKIPESYVLEAEFKSSSKLVAAHFYQEALEGYINREDSAKADEMKLKIKECYEEGQKEFKTIEIPFKLPKDELDSYVGTFLQFPVVEALKRLAQEKSLLPNIEKIKRDTEKQTRGKVSSIFPRVSIRKDNPVLESRTGEEILEDHLIQNLEINYKMNAIVFGKIIDRLEKEKGLNTEIFSGFLETYEIFDKDNLEIISVGLERYFSRDYVSAIHVLTPQLEDVLRGLLDKKGLPTTSTRNGVIREKPLDVIMATPEIKEVLGGDLWYFLKTVLIDQRGENLRHDVAQGLITKNRCNREIVNHLVLSVLKLTELKFDTGSMLV